MKPGERLGPYEILAPIGKGGMGEVWKASDTRLGRDVAIKISAEQFSERFEREARAVAALNHPNICTLYDVGPNYLVMEYIEGATLAERIKEGPIPLEEALGIARHVADALDAAHEKNIIHRDLKPGNIKIKPDGTVKVLDFGLAKIGGTPAAGKAEDSPTLTLAATHAGMILGTAAYMSPEQARGKEVDKRADIWAFGVVLYELLTGERLFKGEDVSETLAQVLTKEPDLNKVPTKARKLLRRCLEKDPKKRLRDIGEAAFHLDDAAPEAAVVSKSKLPWAIAAVLFIALGILAFIHFREQPPATPVQVQRYAIILPEKTSLHSFAISPDGRNVIIAATLNGKRQLWIRPLNALRAQPMEFTEGATYPFWSPDSRFIGFFAEGKLKKVAASGGPSQSLCDAPNAFGGSWSRQNVIVFPPDSGLTSIRQVSAGGGTPVDVFKTKGERSFPVFLPDSRHFLYLAVTPEQAGIYVSSLDGKENRRILADESGAVFAPSSGKEPGYILFIRENTLMAQPFDAASAQTAGDVFPLAEGVFPLAEGVSGVNLTAAKYVPATVSQSGVLLYASGAAGGANQMIAWYDRAGKLLSPVIPPGAVFAPAISPDGKSVAFSNSTNGTAVDLWLRDVARGTETRFTTDPSLNFTPFWAPKGDRIVFASSRTGVFNLFQKASDGSGQDELLLADGNYKVPTQWSRDGRFIVYEELDPKTRFDLWVLPMEGSEKERTPVPFLRTEFNELMGQLSSDGHWMAYTSDQSGRREVYVRPFPRAEGQWTISLGGGEQPRWRSDGKELFFVAADGKLMAVSVKALPDPRPTFEAGTPTALFDAHIAPSATDNVFMYDVTADGKRFLIDTTADFDGSSPPLNVVVNWIAGLKK